MSGWKVFPPFVFDTCDGERGSSVDVKCFQKKSCGLMVKTCLKMK